MNDQIPTTPALPSDPPPPSYLTPDTPEGDGKWYAKKRYAIPAALLALCVIAVALSPAADDEAAAKTDVETVAEVVETTEAPVTTAAPTTEAPTTTAAPTTTEAPTTTKAPTTTISDDEALELAYILLIGDINPDLSTAYSRDSSLFETLGDEFCSLAVSANYDQDAFINLVGLLWLDLDTQSLFNYSANDFGTFLGLTMEFYCPATLDRMR